MSPTCGSGRASSSLTITGAASPAGFGFAASWSLGLAPFANGALTVAGSGPVPQRSRRAMKAVKSPATSASELLGSVPQLSRSARSSFMALPI